MFSDRSCIWTWRCVKCDRLYNTNGWRKEQIKMWHTRLCSYLVCVVCVCVVCVCVWYVCVVCVCGVCGVCVWCVCVVCVCLWCVYNILYMWLDCQYNIGIWEYETELKSVMSASVMTWRSANLQDVDYSVCCFLLIGWHVASLQN
jgi:hypothetical protein